MPDSLKAAVDSQLRVIELLPAGDLTLIVLKGHLLIEELLYVILKSTARHPEAIEEAHLNFYRLAQMAKAFHYEERLRNVWDTIFALNSLRNLFAHDIELKDLKRNLRKFAQAAARGNPNAENLVLSNPEYQIRSSIEFICGALAAIAFPPVKNGKREPKSAIRD